MKPNNYKADAQRTFDKLAVNYENHTYGKQSRILYAYVASRIKTQKHESVLDLGCGKGLFLESLKDFNAQLYGADISNEMIRCARQINATSVELVAAESENLPWKNNSFDVITCILSFHHYPDPIKSLLEIRRVLKNGGQLILAEVWVPSPFRNLANIYMKSVFNRTGDVKVYSYREWQKMLMHTGFINVRIEKVNSFYLLISSEKG